MRRFSGNRWQGVMGNGFTLIEVLLVVAILGVFATVGYPVVHGLVEDESLETATKEVEAAIRYTHLTAATSGSRCRIIISALDDSLVVEKLTPNRDLLNPAFDELGQGTAEAENFRTVRNLRRPSGFYTVYFSSDPRFKNIDIETSSFEPGTPLEYDGFGKPSHGGTVSLVGPRGRTTIRVDAFTGRVTVQ